MIFILLRKIFSELKMVFIWEVGVHKYALLFPPLWAYRILKGRSTCRFFKTLGCFTILKTQIKWKRYKMVEVSHVVKWIYKYCTYYNKSIMYTVLLETDIVQEKTKVKSNKQYFCENFDRFLFVISILPV